MLVIQGEIRSAQRVQPEEEMERNQLLREAF